MIDNSDYGIINSDSDYFVKGESYKEAYNEYLNYADHKSDDSEIKLFTSREDEENYKIQKEILNLSKIKTNSTNFLSTMGRKELNFLNDEKLKKNNNILTSINEIEINLDDEEEKGINSKDIGDLKHNKKTLAMETIMSIINVENLDNEEEKRINNISVKKFFLLKYPKLKFKKKNINKNFKNKFNIKFRIRQNHQFKKNYR